MSGIGSCDGAEAEAGSAEAGSVLDEVDAVDVDGSAAGVEDCDEAADTAEADS